ncbi:esterase/lipase family protein [Salinithrix halophila]|uniref:triacylglycerol lipase n=1 Tax=Salinithrix halophila TaxID=1485204 RepID=A0ABV8JE72_9BACL
MMFFYRLIMSGVAVILCSGLSIGLAHATELSSTRLPYHSSLKAASQEKKIRPSVKFTPVNSSPQNTYPIILVHGLAGFDDLYGFFQYWGGLTDIEKDLRKRGYHVYTADIGTFSSNWDRAVELYAQIKGGRADYGAAHAKKHGHDRYGRTYPGLYPEWGKVDEKTGKVNKVHLIGHSLGGQTVRTLVQLLEHGDKNESAFKKGVGLSPLFNHEQKSWVSSVMAISSPHDGSTLTYQIEEMMPKAQQLIAAFAAISGNRSFVDYDFKLDQWGLKRHPGEPFNDYMKRVCKSSIWKKTKDSSEWDTSLPGAIELNQWVQAQPQVYYFSVGTEQTYRSPFTGHEVPELLMNPAFYSFSFYMGKYTRNFDEMIVDKGWFKNDGMVNTRSMAGPTMGSTDLIVPYNGTPQIGKWNYLGTMKSYDHVDIIGMGIRDMRPWYRGMAALLASLPE